MRAVVRVRSDLGAGFGLLARWWEGRAGGLAAPGGGGDRALAPSQKVKSQSQKSKSSKLRKLDGNLAPGGALGEGADRDVHRLERDVAVLVLAHLHKHTGIAASSAHGKQKPEPGVARRAYLAGFGVAGGAAPAELGGVGGEGDRRRLEALLVQLLVGRAETVLTVQPLL